MTSIESFNSDTNIVPRTVEYITDRITEQIMDVSGNDAIDILGGVLSVVVNMIPDTITKESEKALSTKNDQVIVIRLGTYIEKTELVINSTSTRIENIKSVIIGIRNTRQVHIENTRKFLLSCGISENVNSQQRIKKSYRDASTVSEIPIGIGDKRNTKKQGKKNTKIQKYIRNT